MKIPSYVTVREFESGRRYEVRLEVTGEDVHSSNQSATMAPVTARASSR
ncbi:hypothetical protein [Mycolicibacterium goodii]